MDPTDALIGRYLAGELTPDERVSFERSVDTDATARANLALLRQAWEPDTVVPTHGQRLDTLWRRIEMELHGPNREPIAPAKVSVAAGVWRRSVGGHRGWSWRAWGVAAAAVGAVCVAVAVSRVQVVAPGVTPVPMRDVVSASGQRVAVTFDDGTRVLLNSGSRLRVPRDLGRSRTVELDGEAMFTVVHRGTEPFVVRTREARIAVLGTAFVVRSYSEDRRVRVVVADGRVSVRAVHANAVGEAVLGARMLAEVSDSGQTLLTPDVDVSRYTDWTRGRLVFHDTPLREALTALERRYGLLIRLTDTTLAREQLTATITDDSPEAVLDGIAVTFGVRYIREGNIVTFLPHRAPVPRARSAPLPELTQEMSHGR